MPERRQRTIRLSYWGDPDIGGEPSIVLYDNPNELRISVGEKSFFSVHEDRLSLGGGVPSKISVQSLGLIYAGMIKDVGFPRSLIPSMIPSPGPTQEIAPPMKELIPEIVEFASVASAFVASSAV